jgi:hypothetical protein
VAQDVTQSGNTTYTFSVYLKAAERTFAQLQIVFGADLVAANNVFIDLSTGETASDDPARTFVQNVGNGWWRLATTVTTIAAPASPMTPRILVAQSLTVNSYTGDGTSGILAWGAQLVEGQLPKPYQVTLASRVRFGWVRINQEVMSFTGKGMVGSNVQLTGLTRGALNTSAATHNQFDRVQWVLAYEDQPFQDVIYSLLTEMGGIPRRYIDNQAWDAEKLEWRELYNFTAYITDPVRIQLLVGEICQQAQSNIWWDERVQEIILKAQRPNFLPDMITQNANIIADSVTVEEIAKDRASQVYIYYGLRSPVLPVNDKFSFRSAEVIIDVDKERQYGEPAIKEIFCRWVNTAVLAQSLGSSYLRRFRDVRRHITFNLTAKDIAQFWTGDVAEIEHYLVVNFDGSERVAQWLITSAETVEQGGVYKFIAEDNDSAGVLWSWVADDDTRPVTEIGGWVDADGTDGAGNVLTFSWI